MISNILKSYLDIKKKQTAGSHHENLLQKVKSSWTVLTGASLGCNHTPNWHRGGRGLWLVIITDNHRVKIDLDDFGCDNKVVLTYVFGGRLRLFRAELVGQDGVLQIFSGKTITLTHVLRNLVRYELRWAAWCRPPHQHIEKQLTFMCLGYSRAECHGFFFFLLPLWCNYSFLGVIFLLVQVEPVPNKHTGLKKKESVKQRCIVVFS